MERRLEGRTGNVYRPALITSGSGRAFVTQKNVSESGACFRGDVPVQVGDTIEYSFNGMEDIRAIVRWCEGDLFGVEHLESEQLQGAASVSHPFRPLRVPLEHFAKISCAEWMAFSSVKNISQSGACLTKPAELKVGTLITVELMGLIFEAATVKWVKGERCGIKFARRLSASELNEILIRKASLELRTGFERATSG